MITVSADILNLQAIMDSGQCFRVSVVDETLHDKIFQISSMDKVLRATYYYDTDCNVFDCTQKEWSDYWHNYFDLDTDYDKFYQAIDLWGDDFLKKAAQYGKGMRILRQNFWEALVSFIISQNNNIPKIKKSIEKFCECFGTPIEKYGNIVYSFPKYSEIKAIPPNTLLQKLSDMGLGYRKAYVFNVCTCEQKLLNPDYDSLLNLLGVGPKVASCVRLYGWHDLTQYPVDTWIGKMIDEIYYGKFDLNPYKGFEGFVQQLQFYYYRHLNGK